MKSIAQILRSILLKVAIITVYAPATFAKLTYSFDSSSGVLTVEGNGRTVDSDRVNRAIGRTDFFQENTTLKQVDLSKATGIVAIGNNAFQCCVRLSKITLPATLTSIGGDAFYRCHSIVQLLLPANLTIIGDYAFQYCGGLTELTLPAKLTYLGRNAFEYCVGLKLVRSLVQKPVPFGNDSEAFQGTNVRTIVVPKGTISVYRKAWGDRYTFQEL